VLTVVPLLSVLCGCSAFVPSNIVSDVLECHIPTYASTFTCPLLLTDVRTPYSRELYLSVRHVQASRPVRVSLRKTMYMNAGGSLYKAMVYDGRQRC
jgi:hypothetical protein